MERACRRFSVPGLADGELLVVTPSSSAVRIGVVIPVLNDWVSLDRLLGELDGLEGLAGSRFVVVIVDDGSTPAGGTPGFVPSDGRVESVRVVRLATNLGHQRAIAVGLVIAGDTPDLDGVLVMDSDGEDRPLDVPALIRARRETPDAVIAAARAKRSEGLAFRLSYSLYRLAFWGLTGRTIRFGNFCVLPIDAARSLTRNAAIWNNLAAAISRSRMPCRELPTARGERYAGRSRMSFVGLIVHGLSAISVYADVALVRIMLTALALAVVLLMGLVGVVLVRLFSNLAIPGWASFMAVGLSILLCQALMFAGVSLFQLLSLRTVATIVPAVHARRFIVEPARVDR